MTDALLDYSLNSMKFESFGEDFNNLILRPEKLIQYRGFETFYGQIGTFLKEKLQRVTLVHINFEELKALTVTKDAKIFPVLSLLFTLTS